MDWPQLIENGARVSGILRVDELVRKFATSETTVRNALGRREKCGLVERLGNKSCLNLIVTDFPTGNDQAAATRGISVDGDYPAGCRQI